MLRNNISGKKLILYYLITSILTATITFFGFVILGKYYKAEENTTLINILVWSSIIVLSFLLIYFLYYAFMRFIIKSKKTGTILNGYALASGSFLVFIICLSRPNGDNYSYVNTFGILSSALGFLSIILSIKPKEKKTKKSK